MKIIITKSLNENKYSIEFKVELTEQETVQTVKFGEPSVNFGGTITGPPAFELADHYRDLPSGLPYTYSIDGNGDAEAKDKMLAWQTEIKNRLVAAINSLRNQTDDFTGEVVETV